MKKLIIVFLMFLTVLTIVKTSANAQVATDEGDNVLDKVKEKVESIRNNPKAYIGTVTDKTQDTLQTKNLDGKIDQISITETTTFQKIAKTTTDIKFTDVALGDYVVAMGHKDSSGILQSKQVLLISPLTEPKRRTVLGIVKSITKKEIQIAEVEGATNVFSFPKSWKGPNVSEMKADDRVIIIGIEESGKYVVRTIELMTNN